MSAEKMITPDQSFLNC